jgi:integrase
MPTRSHRQPKYRHFKPKNLAVVRIQGHDHYLGAYDSPESHEKYHRLLAEFHANGTVAPTAAAKHGDDISIHELVLSFYRHAASYYRRDDGTPTGELDNLKLAVRPLTALYGNSLAREFGPLAFKAVRKAMVDSGLGRRTVNQRAARIIRVFRYGVENELIPASVHHALKAVEGLKRGRSGAKESKAVRPVPQGHVEATLPFVSRQVRAMIELQSLTGMRSGEVTIMKGIDVDTAGTVWMYTPRYHKTQYRDKERRIPLGPRAIEVLRPWLRCNLGEYLFQPHEAQAERWREQRQNRKTPMTPSQRARTRKANPKKTPSDHYDTRAYFHAIDRACKKAGVPHWHPHQLRHTFATYVRNNHGLDVARIILGHTSAATTATYALADESKAVDVMAEIG